MILKTWYVLSLCSILHANGSKQGIVDIEEPSHPPYPPGVNRVSSLNKAIGSTPDISVISPPILGHSVSLGAGSSGVSAPSNLTINTSTGNDMPSLKPESAGRGLTPLRRTGSYSTGAGGVAESRRAAIAEMISHIRNYDPYPCILGIPVMPALFSTSKFYIFISFMMIGARVLVEKWKELQEEL